MVQYARGLDTSLAAIADPTRRGILERLGRGAASITDLATCFDMTLTGLKKHVQILEGAGLVKSRKVGRVRTCRLGDRRLHDAADWIARWQRTTNARPTHATTDSRRCSSGRMTRETPGRSGEQATRDTSPRHCPHNR